MTSPDYNAEAFQSELFPLHSPLLRESWLVSFPPLSYMLKFSGYSCLIGGPIGWVTQNQFAWTNDARREQVSGPGFYVTSFFASFRRKTIQTRLRVGGCVDAAIAGTPFISAHLHFSERQQEADANKLP